MSHHGDTSEMREREEIPQPYETTFRHATFRLPDGTPQERSVMEQDLSEPEPRGDYSARLQPWCFEEHSFRQ